MTCDEENKDLFIKYLNELKRKYSFNKKILFVQSLQFNIKAFNKEVAINRGYYAFPANNLLWLAKSISEFNLDVEILDLNYELLRRVNDEESYDCKDWLSILGKYIETYDPTVVGVSCTSVSNLLEGEHAFIQILEYLKERDKQIVLTGGVNATESCKELLENELCHFVFKGESENKIRYFLSSLLGKGNSSEIPGIFFRADGKIDQTRGQEDFVELKGNLIGFYKKIPIEKYHKVGSLNPYSRMAGLDKRYAAIQLNRGCRGNCIFCGVSRFNGPKVRHFPAQDVIDEIDYLVKEHDIKHFEWLDDDLLINYEEITYVLKEIIKRKLEITWAANNGLVAASIDEELLSLMRDSGCVGFKIGIESGNADILKKIRKPATLDILRRVSKMLQKFPELFVGGSYIIGFPNETFGQILDTVKFSRGLNLEWASISVCQFHSWDYSSLMAFDKKQKGEASFDFIPAKESSKDELHHEKDIFSGLDVFEIPKDFVPSREQLKQIWFTLNLVENYINNKNLKPEGTPEQFISWIEAIQAAYPNNPYMCLFASLGYVLLDNKTKDKEQYKKSKRILAESAYWKHRFKQFELDNIMKSFPKNPREVQEILNPLREKFSKFIRIE